MAKSICSNCQYFYITWDFKFPNGCRALDFKSKTQPYLEVQKASQMECQYYKKKEDKKTKSLE